LKSVITVFYYLTSNTTTVTDVQSASFGLITERHH